MYPHGDSNSVPLAENQMSYPMDHGGMVHAAGIEPT